MYNLNLKVPQDNLENTPCDRDIGKNLVNRISIAYKVTLRTDKLDWIKLELFRENLKKSTK